MRHRSDYHYQLPAELIAQAPAERRDGSRLLVVDEDGTLLDHQFSEIATLLPPDALLVINDTRVFPARLRTRKPTGGAVELLFIEPAARPDATDAIDPIDPTDPEAATYWRCMARSSKKLRPGQELAVLGPPSLSGPLEETGARVRIASERGPDSTVVVRVPGDAHDLLERYGDLPLPPYIERPEGSSERDAERYQTVYARERGAIAAPTAGLHFTASGLDELRARGVDIVALTLHVGLGTFAPMRVDHVDEHRMHVERYEISEESAAQITAARRHGQRIIAVGTTCVRALESAALRATGEYLVAPGRASTDLFIRPGFQFRVVESLITNFHLPESTLLMLVSAFAGHERIMAAYRHAVAARYRFFSYGDAMLLSLAT